MKTIVYLLLLTNMLAMAPVTSAQSVNPKQEVIKGEDQRLPIRPEELPEPVKKVLADEEYKDWKVSEAYMVQEERKIYEITLVKGQEKQVIKVDEKGNRLVK